MKIKTEVKTNLKSVKDKKQRKKKLRLGLKKTKLKRLCKNRGVVYINHIPHGFYEEELYEYFSQFGVVTAVKVPRSNKTGNAKGCAFVEFKVNEVAQVAADTMNNYLMFDCLLKTKYIAPKEHNVIAFDRSGKPWKNRSPTHAADLRRKKDKKIKERPVVDMKAFAEKVRACVARMHKNLTSKTGIDYEFQINDDAQLLKVTNKPEDEQPSCAEDGDKTDDKIKVKKRKRKTGLAQAALKNTTKVIKSNTKMMKNNTKTALKNTTKKVLATNKKGAVKNATKKVLASKKKNVFKTTTKKVLKDTKNKIMKKSGKQVKKVTAV